MGNDNNILNQVLYEELNRLNRIESAYKDELLNLPKGKIIYKIIKGKQYPYLQYREGNKIKSRYVFKLKLNDMQKEIDRRAEIEQAINRLKAERNKLVHAVEILSAKDEIRLGNDKNNNINNVIIRKPEKIHKGE